MLYAQRLTAPSDPNGNPQRCWLYYNTDGQLEEVIDEGYGGTPHTPAGRRTYRVFNRHKKIVELPTLPVSTTTYRNFISFGSGN